MDADAFQRAADEAYESLPAELRAAIVNVAIVIEEWPDGATMAEMEAESPYELLGLYSGWPLPERGIAYGNHPPDMVRLFRQPILDYCEEYNLEIESCIRHVLIHELGHYFGFSDEEMEAIEWRPESE